MLVLALALASAVTFGATTAALRFGLRAVADPEIGALVSTSIAFLVAGIAAAAGGAAPLGGGSDVAVFVAAGLIAPGASTVLFTRAVQDSGPSRTSIVVGASPLAAAVIAVGLLGEPADPVILAGGIFVVLGGFALLGERHRPERFRSVGIAFAIAAMTLVAVRDNLIRAHSEGTAIEPTLAAAITLATSTTSILAYLLLTRRRRLRVGIRQIKSFAAAGLLFGLSLILLFEAYYRGRVTVVSPLIATEAIWGVGFAALFFRRTELVGQRLIFSACLIVLGSAIIGSRQ